jgi:hypothetical protein
MRPHLLPLSLLRGSLLAALMVASPVVLAAGVSPEEATAPQKKEAMRHFATGKHAAESKNWEEAQAELRASLEIVDSPNTRLLLARALRDGGDVGRAWIEYGRTTDDATRLAAKDEHYTLTADAAKLERGELDAKLAFVTVTLAHAPADATLKVGGRIIAPDARSAPVVVPPGAVDVVLADADGKELARKTVAVALGDKTPVILDANPPAPETAAPAAPVADDVPPRDTAGPDDAKVEAAPAPGGRDKLRPYAYVAGGAGAVGLIVFAVFGAMEKSTFSGLQSACPGNVCPPDKASDISNGKTQQVVANVALGVGIAGVAAGGTLFVLSLGGKAPAAPPAASASLVVGPTFIGLRGAL